MHPNTRDPHWPLHVPSRRVPRAVAFAAVGIAAAVLAVTPVSASDIGAGPSRHDTALSTPVEEPGTGGAPGSGLHLSVEGARDDGLAPTRTDRPPPRTWHAPPKGARDSETDQGKIAGLWVLGGASVAAIGCLASVLAARRRARSAGPGPAMVMVVAMACLVMTGCTPSAPSTLPQDPLHLPLGATGDVGDATTITVHSVTIRGVAGDGRDTAIRYAEVDITVATTSSSASVSDLDLSMANATGSYDLCPPLQPQDLPHMDGVFATDEEIPPGKRVRGIAAFAISDDQYVIRRGFVEWWAPMHAKRWDVDLPRD